MTLLYGKTRLTELLSSALVEIIKDYFLEMTKVSAQIGVPYLLEKDNELSYGGYSSYVSLMGVCKGVMMFSADKKMLNALVQYTFGTGEFIGVLKKGDEWYQDIVGEVSNVLAGNSRKILGDDFAISVPKVVDTVSFLPKGSVIVPVVWKDYDIKLGFNFEEGVKK